MRSKRLLQNTAVASLIFAIACFFLMSGMLPQQYSAALKESATKDAEKIYCAVSIKEIKYALTKSNSKKIILNIYPVKLSGNPDTKDFSLQVFYQDAGESGKNLGNPINRKKFNQQSAWYIDYLKKNNIPANKIPYGYFIKIDPAFIKHKSGINIWVLSQSFQIQYCLIPDIPVQPVSPTHLSGDSSTCKCPPECCCPTLSILSDSTGKCPPECIAIPLLLGSSVKKIINERYKSVLK